MPAGIQVFNADGTVQLDMSTRLFRTLAVTATTSSSGSTVVPGLSTAGTPVAIIATGADAGGGDTKEVTFSGDTVSWTSGPASEIYIMVY